CRPHPMDEPSLQTPQAIRCSAENRNAFRANGGRLCPLFQFSTAHLGTPAVRAGDLEPARSRYRTRDGRSLMRTDLRRRAAIANCPRTENVMESAICAAEIWLCGFLSLS